MLSLMETGALGSVVLALATGAVLVGDRSPVDLEATASASRGGLAPGIAVTRDSLTPLVSRNPFRISRVPAPIPYDPIQPVTPDQPPPRPAFAVTGILWGPSPLAFLEGLPGTDGARIVRPGDTIGEFRILRIARAAVTVRGPDTTWTVSIRTPWR